MTEFLLLAAVVLVAGAAFVKTLKPVFFAEDVKTGWEINQEVWTEGTRGQ